MEINSQRLKELYSITNGEKLVRDLITIFNQYRTQIEAMEGFIHEKNFYQCKFVAHKMKAAAANLGAETLAKQCDFFENLEESNAACAEDEILKRYRAFRKDYEQVTVALEDAVKEISHH